MKKKRTWIIIITGILLTALIVAGLGWWRQGNTATAQTEEGEIVTAFIGDLSASATTTGRLAAAQTAQLALDRSGVVESVHVAVGDIVAAGDPLVQLETGALERAVATAEQALIVQENNLAGLLAPPDAADVASMEAAIASAQAQLDDLINAPDEDSVAAAEANLRAAEANVWAASENLALAQDGASEAEIAAAQADLIAAQGEQEQLQELYDDLLECFSFETPEGTVEVCPGLGNPEEQTRFNLATANANLEAARASLNELLAGPDPNAVAVAQANLGVAVAQRDASQANLDLVLQGASAAQIAAAESSLAQAEANLDALLAGPTAAQITLSEIQVEQARINLARAEQNLADATLRAPFAGLVTAVSVSPGETASGAVVELVDVNSLEVVLEVDEVDIGAFTPGQAVAITLEAWPDTEIDGELRTVAPKAIANRSELVTYEAYVTLGETDLPLLVGMTAEAELTTARRENVLLVPNQAINADRSNNLYTVNLVQEDGTMREVEVTIGLRDRSYTEITGGLNEGDRLRINAIAADLPFGPGQGQGQGPFSNGG